MASLNHRSAHQGAILGLMLGLALMGLMTFNARGQFQTEVAHFDKNQKLYQWMLSQKPQIEAAELESKPQPEQSLISIVTAAAESYGVSLSHYLPDGDNEVQLSTKDSPLGATMAWVNGLQREDQLRVVSMSLSRGSENGLCDLHIQLRSKKR